MEIDIEKEWKIFANHFFCGCFESPSPEVREMLKIIFYSVFMQGVRMVSNVIISNASKEEKNKMMENIITQLSHFQKEYII